MKGFVLFSSGPTSSLRGETAKELWAECRQLVGGGARRVALSIPQPVTELLDLVSRLCPPRAPCSAFSPGQASSTGASKAPSTPTALRDPHCTHPGLCDVTVVPRDLLNSMLLVCQERDQISLVLRQYTQYSSGVPRPRGHPFTLGFPAVFTALVALTPTGLAPWPLQSVGS